MGYKIVQSSSGGATNSRADSAKGALEQIAKLKTAGWVVGPIIDEDTGRAVEESQLRLRAAQDGKRR